MSGTIFIVCVVITVIAILIPVVVLAIAYAQGEGEWTFTGFVAGVTMLVLILFVAKLWTTGMV